MKLILKNRRFLLVNPCHKTLGLNKSRLNDYLQDHGFTKLHTHDKKTVYETKSFFGLSSLRAYGSDVIKKILKNKRSVNYAPFRDRHFFSYMERKAGHKFFPHQKDALCYSLSRNKSYLGMVAGTGKTPVAAAIAEMHTKVLVIVPPSLTINTLVEFEKWGTKKVSIWGTFNEWEEPEVIIASDAIIKQPEFQTYINDYFCPDLIICDEAHRFKERTSARTIAVYGWQYRERVKVRGKRLTKSFGIIDQEHVKRVVMMSGNPMPDKPIELYTSLFGLAHSTIDFMPYNTWGKLVCNGFKQMSYDGGRSFGWDYSGCNVDEFKKYIKKFKSKNWDDKKGFMLRINKEILNLPKITREIIILNTDISLKLAHEEKKLLKIFSPEDLMKENFEKKLKLDEDEVIHLATHRRMLAESKIEPSVQRIKEHIENGEKVVVFGIHTEALKKLRDKLKHHMPLFVIGETGNAKEKDKLVRMFQAGKSDLFIANIDTMYLGHTLTRATKVCFFEFATVQYKNDQATDRVYRIGLNHTISVEYFVFRNSIESKIATKLIDSFKIQKLL